MELYYNSLDLSYYDGSRKYYSYVDDDKNYVYQGYNIFFNQGIQSSSISF